MDTGTSTKRASTSGTTPSDTLMGQHHRSASRPRRPPHHAFDGSSSFRRAARRSPLGRRRRRAAPILEAETGSIQSRPTILLYCSIWKSAHVSCVSFPLRPARCSQGVAGSFSGTRVLLPSWRWSPSCRRVALRWRLRLLPPAQAWMCHRRAPGRTRPGRICWRCSAAMTISAAGRTACGFSIPARPRLRSSCRSLFTGLVLRSSPGWTAPAIRSPMFWIAPPWEPSRFRSFGWSPVRSFEFCRARCCPLAAIAPGSRSAVLRDAGGLDWPATRLRYGIAVVIGLGVNPRFAITIRPPAIRCRLRSNPSYSCSGAPAFLFRAAG